MQSLEERCTCNAETQSRGPPVVRKCESAPRLKEEIVVFKHTLREIAVLANVANKKEGD